MIRFVFVKMCNFVNIIYCFYRTHRFNFQTNYFKSSDEKTNYIYILFCISLHIDAEQTHEWEQFLYQLSELEDIESSSWESSFELLCDLEENPININTASREDLEQFPF